MSCRWTIGPLLEGVLVFIGILITPIFCAVATGNQVAEAGNQVAEAEAGEVVSGGGPDLWSFKPLDLSIAAASSIDEFIARSHSDRNLQPLAPATKGTLLRRVYFDLIGLPPSPAELDAFLADNSSTAYEKVVDQLLSNPQHGVRYARHWLDILRYADVDRGMPAEPGIYHWRDWVIDALNRDLPYDQFVRAQIAGDLSSNPSDQYAVGFLARAAHSLSDGAQEIAFSGVDTVSSAFLGMTVACAKCHDHFYDEITQREYYQMKLLFDGLVLEKETLATDKEEEAHKQVLAEWDAKKKTIQKRMDKITDPYYQALYEERLALLPPEIETIYRKPKEERSAEEQKLANNYAPVVNIDARKFRDAMPAEETETYESIRQQLVKLQREPPTLPVFWNVKDMEKRRKKHGRILESADPGKPLEKVTPGFPFANIDIAPDHPAPRQVFLDWLTSSENPIFARVVVNRLWQWHFGTGLVTTPSDFGNNGADPTHSELLDWLALQLIKHNYSMKAIHRLIVTSETYCRGSSGSTRLIMANRKMDPGNKYLWKFNLRRLEAEIIRDAVLYTAGDLDLTIGGKSFRAVKWMRRRNSGRTVGNYDNRSNRRGIYMGRGHDVSMEMLPEMLQVFDGEDGQSSCPTRQITITAPQALFMLNSPLTEKSAKQLAQRLFDSSGNDFTKTVELGYKMTLSRIPTPIEKQQAIQYLAEDSSRVQDFAWSLLNLTEFIYVK
jgi:hypothetical protein